MIVKQSQCRPVQTNKSLKKYRNKLVRRDFMRIFSTLEVIHDYFD